MYLSIQFQCLWQLKYYNVKSPHDLELLPWSCVELNINLYDSSYKLSGTLSSEQPRESNTSISPGPFRKMPYQWLEFLFKIIKCLSFNLVGIFSSVNIPEQTQYKAGISLIKDDISAPSIMPQHQLVNHGPVPRMYHGLTSVLGALD